ncbi:MAG: tRNA lysidine(34) synthetase TilS [Myxococcaceae bacterium]|nr:tRNA lysidine(34) synthetase TilS [Myxococcaceae bacterium]
MALAEAAHRQRVPIEVACLDHGLRIDSVAEVELVQSWASARGVAFHTRRLSLERGPGLEARARAARYEALLELARNRQSALVATAHTASDQAETVLMRLTRGSSLRGAAGIRPLRADGVIRPLLFATREETRRYVQVRAVRFIDDPMNEDPSFLRVRMRREVIPLLERVVGAHAVTSLARAARYAAEDDAWLSADAATALERCRLPEGLDRFAVLSLGPPIRRRVVAAWLEEQAVAIDAHHLDDALTAIGAARTATLPGDRLLTVSRGTLTISPAPARLHATSSRDDGHGQK